MGELNQIHLEIAADSSNKIVGCLCYHSCHPFQARDCVDLVEKIVSWKVEWTLERPLLLIIKSSTCASQQRCTRDNHSTSVSHRSIDRVRVGRAF